MNTLKSSAQDPDPSIVVEGSKNDNEKTPVDLLAPDAMWSVADVLKFGARKYASWNWYQGIKYSRIFGAVLRHLWQWWRGEEYDRESGLHHLAHAGCELMFLLQFVLEGRVELDNRPQWKRKSYFISTGSDQQTPTDQV